MLTGWSLNGFEKSVGAALFLNSSYAGEERLDRHGITMLYPTVPNGRVWASRWENDIKRRLPSGSVDPFDPEFTFRGEGMVTIDGEGTAVLSGAYPRMYVYDSTERKKWNNVEVTVYSRRGKETSVLGSQGIIVGARSEHQNVTPEDLCEGATYYGKLFYDGRAVFQKELIHETLYSSNKPDEEHMTSWNTQDGTMPKDLWVGMKFVVRTDSKNDTVILELYRDLTDGLNGGYWEKVATYTDSGEWLSSLDANETRCPRHAQNILLAPGTSVFIRNDFVEDVAYKNFSIREIRSDVKSILVE